MIFYFTGTGNSLYAAQKLLEDGERLVNIGATVKSREFTYELKLNERVGFVCPVYFGGLPNIVSWFIRKLELTGSTPAYVYAVLTCGGNAMDADHMIRKALEKKNLFTDAVYQLIMPDNAFIYYDLPTEEEQDKVLKTSDKEIARIRTSVTSMGTDRTDGAKEYNSGIKGRILTGAGYPLYEGGRKTSKFWTNDSCVSCGVCAKRCPVGAIELIDGKVTWVKERCIHCLGCTRCGAIQYGKKSETRNRWKNPVFRKKTGAHNHGGHGGHSHAH